MCNVKDGKMIKGTASVDLHVHTLDSDGMFSIEDVLGKILEAKIDVFSITDHETMKNYEIIEEFADKANLTWIPGVEITVNFKGKKHILAYGVDPYNEELQKVMNENQYLVANKLDAECQGFPLAEDVIAIIKEANGIAVLAHPGCKIYPGDPKHLVHEMIDLGIDGIECYHPDNAPELVAYCLNLRKEKKLYITGGSDYHGKENDERKLHGMKLSFDMLHLPNIEKNEKK